MDILLVLLAAAGLLTAGIVKGATGLGYASCALPFLVATVGLKAAMALVLIPAMATNVSVALSTGHFRETVHKFAALYIAMLGGIPLGLVLLLYVDQRIATSLLGAVMIVYSVLTLARPGLTIPVQLQRSLQVPAGFLNGMVTGLTGSQVIPLIPYMMALRLDPAQMVQGVNTAVMIASVALGVGLAVAGILTPLVLAMSVAAVVPALIGVELGSRLRHLLAPEQFRRIVLLILLIMGAGMILRT